MLEMQAPALGPSPPAPIKFRSPFSVTRGYELKWTRVDPHWRGVEQAYTWTTDRDEKILKMLRSCRFLTRSQIAKHFWRGSPVSGEKRLNKMARMGVLIAHTMVSPSSTIIMYTIGPIGARVLKIPYTPNWWQDVEVEEVLKALIISQFYLRLHRLSEDLILLPAPPPYDAVISFQGNELVVLALRSGDSLPEALNFLQIHRLMVICENKEDIIAIAPKIKQPVRYTTDEALFRQPLDKAFYYFDQRTRKIQQDNVTVFKEQD